MDEYPFNENAECISNSEFIKALVRGRVKNKYAKVVTTRSRSKNHERFSKSASNGVTWNNRRTFPGTFRQSRRVREDRNKYDARGIHLGGVRTLGRSPPNQFCNYNAKTGAGHAVYNSSATVGFTNEAPPRHDACPGFYYFIFNVLRKYFSRNCVT